MGLFSRKKDKKQAEAEPEPETETPVVEEEQPTEEAPAEESTKAAKSGGAYFVSPHPDGGWQVKKANAQKALKKFRTKAEAEAYAKQVASNQGTTVVRQKKDGKIQKKR
ncbi:MAG: DUF2188 domain-containing protein [Thermoplasmata archaeon]|nr:DUF2188 domain-containing protein [Thermoplasmata archaeon]